MQTTACHRNVSRLREAAPNKPVGNVLVPALTVSDPHADAETVQDLSVQGEAVTRSGATLSVDDDGVVYRDGRPVVDTGTVAGVLDDGSGGGYSQARIKEQLERLSRAIAVVNLLALAAGKAGLVSGPGGLALGAVAAYGRVLARLYGQVSLAITIMNADHLDRAIGQAAIALGCNLAKDLAMFRVVDDISPWIENVLGSVGGPSIC